MTFGEKLTYARKQKKIRQSDLGKLVGTSGDIVGKYERGENVPSIEIAKRLANALEISLDYLVGDAEAEIDKVTLNRVREINKLKEDEKNLVYAFLDAFITKSKLQNVLQ